MSDLRASIAAAAASGHLLAASSKNLLEFLDRTDSPLYRQSIAELVAGGHWSEIDDRFFKTLAFGTGGLRGRTIGKIVTNAERGTPQALDRPEHTCVGTNAMNSYNISPRDAGAGGLREGAFRQHRRHRPAEDRGRPRYAPFLARFRGAHRSRGD